MRRVGVGPIVLLVASLAAGPAAAFVKVVETGVVAPGVNVNFAELRDAAIDGDDIAFCGQSFSAFGKNGVYRAELGGDVAVIATDSTASPSGGGNFRDMCINAEQMPTIDAGQVAFPAYSSTVQGIYLHDGQSLATVVDDQTMFPDTTASPLRFEAPSLRDRIAITWNNTPQMPVFAGVYSFDATEALFAVVDTSYPFFNISAGTVGGGTYVWGVNDTPLGPSHVYRQSYAPAGPVELVASTGQQIDGGHFVLSPGFPQADRSDGDQLCFIGGILAAVYRYDGSEVELVADTSTPIPDGTGNFTGFGLHCAMEAGEVVFQATGANEQNGVYLAHANGVLEKVVDTGDSLDGETPFQFKTGREALSNGRVAFVAYVASQQTIWVTPEPDGLAAGALALLTLWAARGGRRRSARSPRDTRGEPGRATLD